MTFRRQPLKHLAAVSVSNVDKKSAEGDHPVRLVNYTDVYYGDRITPDLPLMKATATSQQLGAFRLDAGDVAITKDSETAEDIGIAAFIEASAPDMVLGYHLALLRPRPDMVDPRYLYWAMRSDVARGQLSTGATGVTRFGLRTDVIATIALPTPSLPTQRVIADFLDTETARIDALIARERRIAALLDERRWVSFLDRVERTGARRVPFRRALRSITDGPFGSALTSDEYTDAGVAVIRLGNIGFAKFRNGDLAHLAPDRFEEFARHRVMKGDVLFAGLGDERNHAGRACVAPELGPAIVKGKCFCARLDQTRADPHFVALYFSSPAGAESVAVEARGSTRSMINLEIIKSVPLPLPPVELQQAIAMTTSQEWAVLDCLKQRLLAQIHLLQEYRQALITAAVAGEFDIPGLTA